jgi:hypothetical protein
MATGCLSSSTTDSGLRPTPFVARLISRNYNRMQRLRGGVLDLLPKGHVFDGELVVLFSEESTPNADRH